MGPLGGNTSLVKMENIFKRASARTLNGVPVKFEEIDDAGDPALARTIAKSLASKPETLMVVGHVLSSTTKEALPVYMNADPQIPVILTTETNPQILPASADPDQEFPVSRSPTDDDQAQSAYQFARNLGAQRFWVVEDPANAVYTKDLANKFLEDAQRNTTRVLLQTSVMNPPSMQVLDRLGVQWVFFAGEWRGALTLIRSLKAMNPTHINFILSDAAASPELLDNGGADVEGIYVMHQLKAKDFRDQGYGVYANNALEIIDRLLAKADQRFSSLAREEVGLPYMVRQTLRIHRVSDARRVLIKCMNRSMASPFRMSTGEVFRFRKTARAKKRSLTSGRYRSMNLWISTRQRGRSHLRNCWRAVVLVRWRPRRALPCASCQKERIPRGLGNGPRAASNSTAIASSSSSSYGLPTS